ncbi:MAG: ABC transporter permease [Firmicutes bacterium]|nr:ABC transporter permease [Bacillota bacterium]
MAEVSLPTSQTAPSVSFGRQALRRLLRNPGACVGLVVLTIIALAAIFAPYVATHDPLEQRLPERLQGPSPEHWLGTDDFGRDLFSRIVYGARISLRIGFTSVSIALVVGGTMGLVAAYYGGWIDHLLMRIVDILLAIPSILLAITIVTMLGPGLNNVMIAVGLATVPSYARIMRAAVLAVRESDYVQAAIAAGASDLRVMVRHILPNCMAPIIVQATLSLATAILTAAGLSFIGLGAQPPEPEWGAMAAQSRQYMRQAHHVVTFPGLAIAITVLALNLVGDGLRDALDPRLN